MKLMEGKVTAKAERYITVHPQVYSSCKRVTSNLIKI